jgi:hypothetical protein
LGIIYQGAKLTMTLENFNRKEAKLSDNGVKLVDKDAKETHCGAN